MNLEFIVPLLYPAGLAAALLSLWRPRLGIYYLVPLLPLQTLRYELHSYPFGASIIDIVLLGVVFGLFLQRRAPLFAKLPVRNLLLLFIFYLYLSLWNGSATLGQGWPLSFSDGRVSDWKNLAELCLLCFFVFAAIESKQQVRTVVLLLLVSTLILNLDFYLAVHGEDFSHYSYTLRYSGMMGYAGVNGLAAFEAQFALFVLGSYNSRLSTPRKLLLALVLLSCLYGLLFTFSRAAYIAFAIGVAFLGLMKRRSLLIVGIMILAGASVLLPRAVVDRVTGTYAQGQGTTEIVLDNSSNERLLIWQDAFELIKTSPLRGIGYATYRSLHRIGDFQDTHNFYIKVMLEEGIIGFSIFLVLLWRMFRVGLTLSHDRSDPLYSGLGLGFATCMVGVVVVNFFGDRWSYQQVNSNLWILLGLLCRVLLLNAEDATDDTPQRNSAIDAVADGAYATA
jgi:O-antigen ligase